MKKEQATMKTSLLDSDHWPKVDYTTIYVYKVAPKLTSLCLNCHIFRNCADWFV